MKKLYTLGMLLCTLSLSAQTSGKFVLVEHFTNTRCGICSSVNPGIYEALGKFPKQVHHISIHPPEPYESCVLYQYNVVDNEARQTYYNVRSTPKLYINGKFTGSQPAAIEQEIEAAMAETAGLQIRVEEGTGQKRTVSVTVSSEADFADANYKIFVALLERDVNYDAPNGEKQHHDVLRDMVSDPKGDVITLPAAGEMITLKYEVEIPDDVVTDEAYILAYIQNEDTQEVLNSGTEADGTVLSNRDLAELAALTTYPNPAQSILKVSVNEDHLIKHYSILNTAGQSMRSVNMKLPSHRVEVPLHELPSGNYLIKVEMEGGYATRAFIKK